MAEGEVISREHSFLGLDLPEHDKCKNDSVSFVSALFLILDVTIPELLDFSFKLFQLFLDFLLTNPAALKFLLLLDSLLGFAAYLLHEFVVSKTFVAEADRGNIVNVLVKDLPSLLLALNHFLEVSVDHGTQVRLCFVNRLWGQACHLHAEIHHFNVLLVEKLNLLLYKNLDRNKIRNEDQDDQGIQGHDKLSREDLGKSILPNLDLALLAVDYDRGLLLRRATLSWQQETVKGKLAELFAVTLIVKFVDQRLASGNVTVVGRALSK